MVNNNALFLDTNLGLVLFNAYCNGTNISKTLTGTKAISEFCTCLTFESEEFEAQLLRISYFANIPSGMHVDHSISSIWIVSPHISDTVFSFDCYLQTSTTVDDSPDSGEGLLALTMNRGDDMLTMGTADEEFLQIWTKRSKYLPPRLAPNIEPEMVEYIPHGMRVILPSLQAKEKAHMHFNVVWKSNAPTNDQSTYFAVDQSPLELLKDLKQ